MRKMNYYKSLIYTPSIYPERFNKLPDLGADACVIDLEDSVPKHKKEVARKNIKKFFKNKPKIPTAVRINSISNIEGIRDLIILKEINIKPDFIVMSMVKSSIEVNIIKDILGEQEEKNIPIYCTVETPEAMMNIEKLSDICEGFILGSADYSAALGVDISWNNMLYARYQLLTAAAKNGIPAIDTACFNIDNLDLLREECQKSKELGFIGKAAIHTRQIPIINQIFSLDKYTIEKAEQIINAYNKSDGAVTNLKGELIGPPFVIYAKKIMNRVNNKL